MRIALIVPGGVDRSGERRVIPALLALIERLAAGNDVEVFALGQEPEPGEWRLCGARVVNIGAGRLRRRTLHAIWRRHRIAPFDIVHAIWSGTVGLIAVLAARALRIPSVVHIAGGELAALPEIDYGGLLTPRGRIREHIVLRAASVVTAPSAPVIDRLAVLGLTASRVPLGVDRGVWPPRAPRRRRAGTRPKLIHVASLNRVKDQTTLLRALAAPPLSGCDFELDVIGEDTLRGEVQALATRLGLQSKVRFHGFLTQQQLRPLVEAAALMVHSSRHEAGPLVLLEAAMAGVPTVGTAVGHIAEFAPVAAVAVPVGDYAALAREVGRMLGDEELRLRIARAAHARALSEDADHTARLFLDVYERLTQASPTTSVQVCRK